MTYQTKNKQLLYPLSGSFTGSLHGTASYATTASYALNGGSGNVGNTTFISTGSISASVNITDIFLVKSGSINLLQISQSGVLTINSNATDIFLIKNFNNQNIFKVSNASVTLLTSSITRTDSYDNGSFYFTSSSFYVSLD